MISLKNYLILLKNNTETFLKIWRSIITAHSNITTKSEAI